MAILIVVLILFGSFANSLLGEKCRFDRIYNEVLRFCKGSDYPGCSNDLNNFPVFLKFFLNSTEFFCHLPRVKDNCKPCSLNGFSWNDLVAGEGSGNGTSNSGNGTNSTGSGNQTTP